MSERPPQSILVTLLVSTSFLRNQCRFGELREFGRSSLGKRSAKFQDTPYHVLRTMMTLAQCSQVFDSELWRTPPESKKGNPKVGLQRCNPLAIDLPAERLAKLKETLGIAGCLDFDQPLIEPRHQQRGKRIGTTHANGPCSVQVNNVGDRRYRDALFETEEPRN